MNGQIRYFSMFTGVGGFELGFQQASNSNQQSTKIKQDWEGWNRDSDEGKRDVCLANIPSFYCVGFSEIDKYSSKLLAEKFPTVKNYGDCTKINPAELPDFDLFCGGFPCQAFSIAGKRRGFEDTRGTMFFEVARILEAKRPKFVFLENVKGLLNHNKGETFKVIIQTLEELGYRTQWMVLNSKFFGVPQNRERVFIIGSLGTEYRPEILPFRYESKQIMDTGEVAGALQADYFKGDRTGGYAIKEEQYKSIAYRTRTYANQPGRIEMRDDKVTNQLTTVQKDSMLFNGIKIRRLTPTECERLQGFPDNWTSGFSDTQRYKMMGNAVTVNVIQAIVQRWFYG